ncbi:MAG TPA: glycosyltransferase [Blastocatellia bacterium]|nr:glycosyltransferase [Blastocatellia bacterium]
MRIETARDASQTRRLRVLHFINSFEIGGTERQAVELLRRLDRERFEVRLAAIHWRGPLYEEIADLYPDLPQFPLTSFYNRNAWSQFRRLSELLRRERIDILHAHDFYSGLLGSAAGRAAGVRVIAAQRHLKLSDRRVHEWGTRLIHRLAHRVLVNSEAIRSHLLTTTNIAPEKIVVIYNGLRSAEAGPRSSHSVVHAELCRELNLPRESRLIGMVARLQPVKGHRYFIEAAAQVARELSDVHFVLVGDGPLRDEIVSQAVEAGIAERLHLLGDRADAARLVAGFDLSVLTSLHEGLPNAVLEAMAAGTPVVATRVGGTAELIRDGVTGWLVPPADPAALAGRIMRALQNEYESAEFAAAAQQQVGEQFCMSRMVSSVESLYDELMQ